MNFFLGERANISNSYIQTSRQVGLIWRGVIAPEQDSICEFLIASVDGWHPISLMQPSCTERMKDVRW